MRFPAFGLLFLLLTPLVVAQTYIASTIAGSNPIGDAGPARAARLNGLQGVSADGKGNVYLSDLSSRRIRVINREGVINTLAGGGTGNVAEGVAATSVRLQSPFGLAYNTRTNELYFSDDVLGLVLAVDIAKGTLRTLAGSPGKLDGGDGGPATNAGLFGPKGLSLDTDQNNLYIADSLNSLVRKVDLRTGVITTVAGILDAFGFLGDGGPANRATLSGPEHVAWSPDGYLYIADTFN